MDKETTKTVDKISNINFQGNLTPDSWFQHIKRKTIKGNSKTDLLAVFILSEIIYWYRKTIESKRKFNSDKWQISYLALADKLGSTKRAVKRSVDLLIELGLITREFRNFATKTGLVLSNVMFIEPVPDKIIAITSNPSCNKSKGDITINCKTYTKTSTENSSSSPEEERKKIASPEEGFNKAYKEIYGSNYNIKQKEITLLSAYKEDRQELIKDFDALPAYIKYLTNEEKLNGLKYLTLTLFLKGNNDRLQKLHSFRLYGTDDLGEITEAKMQEKIDIDSKKEEDIEEEYSNLKRQMPDEKTFYNWAKQDEDRRDKWSKSYKPITIDEIIVGVDLMKDYLAHAKVA